MDNINQTIVSGIPSTTSACLQGIIAPPSFPESSCFDFAPGGVGAPAGIAIPDGSSAVQDADITTVNKSIFGQYEYDMDDKFTFILGYRWSEDDKKIKFNSAYVNNTTVTNPVELFNAKTSLAAAGLSDNDKIDYGDYAARVQLDWRIQDELLIFASYNRGIKGGNWSVNSKVKAESFRHDPETLHAFELGLKKTIADFGHVHASTFYYDYQDYQAFALTDLAAQVSNSDATIKGAEIELFLSPNQQWDLLLGAAFVDSEVAEVFDANGGIMTKNEMPNAPGYSLNFSSRYTWPAFNGQWTFQLDGVSNDSQYLEVTNGETSRESAYSVFNTNISYTNNSQAWTLTLWMKNITNTEYRTYNLDLGRLGATSFYAPPRWTGITLSYVF